VGQPLPFDVVPEGDLAQTPVVPRARENLLLLAVGGSQGLTTGRVRAGRALVAVRVAVDPGIPGSARSACSDTQAIATSFLAYSFSPVGNLWANVAGSRWISVDFNGPGNIRLTRSFTGS
jgi:hypothetical protein